MSNILHMTADVLDKMANYIDAVEKEAESTKLSEKTKAANNIVTVLQDIAGESITDGIVEKIAKTDNDVVDLLSKIASTIQDADSLGGPSERSGVPAGPLSSKDQVKLAEDRLLSWLMS